MAVLTTEQSTQDGAPIELFRFVGTYTTYYRTSAPESITNTEATWVANAIKRSEFEEGTQEDDDLTIDIEMPASDQMVTDYCINVPPPGLALQILRVHRNDLNDALTLWDGEVVSWTIKGRTAKCRVPSLFSYIFNKPLPRIKYQGPCNHVLGDRFCKVDMTTVDNNQDTTISTIVDNVVTIADTSVFADDECVGGSMIAASEQRMIVSNTGTSFTLASPFSPNVAALDAVSVRRGCNHQLTNGGHCIDRYSNGSNYGGFPYVPTRNPFQTRL